MRRLEKNGKNYIDFAREATSIEIFQNRHVLAFQYTVLLHIISGQ